MRMSLRKKHEGEVIHGEEARIYLREIGWDEAWPEGPRVNAVASCKCGWFAPALHGEQAENLLVEHLHDN